MKLTRILSPADAKVLRAKLRGHACHYAELPTLQVTPADTRTEDQREFDRDMCYLRDLANAVMDEYRRNTRAITEQTAIDDLARLTSHCENSDADGRDAKREAYRADMQDYIAEASM